MQSEINTPCQHGQVRVLRRTVVPRFKPSSRWKTEVTRRIAVISTICKQLRQQRAVINDSLCQWDKANFDPPFLEISFFNSPHIPNLSGQVSGANSLSQLLAIPFCLFVYSSYRVLATPLDRTRRAMAHSTCFPPRKCILVVSIMK